MGNDFKPPVGKIIGKPAFGWLTKSDVLGKVSIPITHRTEEFPNVWSELESLYHTSRKYAEAGILNIRKVELDGKELTLGAFNTTGGKANIAIKQIDIPALVELVQARKDRNKEKSGGDDLIKMIGLTQTDITNSEKGKAIHGKEAEIVFLKAWEKLGQEYDNTKRATYSEVVLIPVKGQEIPVWRDYNGRKPKFDEILGVEIHKPPLRTTVEGKDLLMKTLKEEMDKYQVVKRNIQPKGTYIEQAVNQKNSLGDLPDF